LRNFSLFFGFLCRFVIHDTNLGLEMSSVIPDEAIASTGRRRKTSTEDEILASAEAILLENQFPLSRLPPHDDMGAWKQVKDDLKLSTLQIRALKKYMVSQDCHPMKKPKLEEIGFSACLDSTCVTKEVNLLQLNRLGIGLTLMILTDSQCPLRQSPLW
jgi:hypothetical protein